MVTIKSTLLLILRLTCLCLCTVSLCLDSTTDDIEITNCFSYVLSFSLNNLFSYHPSLCIPPLKTSTNRYGVGLIAILQEKSHVGRLKMAAVFR